MNDKEILFKIRNLKQHFPLKKRGLAVRAVDGVDVEIYAGETLGLVGESGCGKSTFGRVLLQLYHQTDGKTLYYGRSLDDLAPLYVKETITNLARHKSALKEKEREYEELQAVYEKLAADGEAEQKQVFIAQNAAIEAEKVCRNAYLDIVQLIGGFFIVEDLSSFVPLLLDVYQHSRDRHDTEEELKDPRPHHRGSGAGDQGDREEGRATLGKKQHLEKLNAQRGAIEARLKESLANLMRPMHALKRSDEYAGTRSLPATRRAGQRHRPQPPHLQRDAPPAQGDAVDLPGSLLVAQPPHDGGPDHRRGALAHRFFKQDGPEMQEYVMSVMEECGLAHMIHRYPTSSPADSGADRHRPLLALNPRFIVCDEAVSALDVSIRPRSSTCCVISRRRASSPTSSSATTWRWSSISDRIGVMYLGNLFELAPAERIFSRTMHPYTEALPGRHPHHRPEAEGEGDATAGGGPSPIRPPAELQVPHPPLQDRDLHPCGA